MSNFGTNLSTVLDKLPNSVDFSSFTSNIVVFDDYHHVS